MKALKDNTAFHKQMQNKAQEILSKAENECCLFKAYLEWVSLLVDRSETSHSPDYNCDANSLVRGENRMDKGGKSAAFSSWSWELFQVYKNQHFQVKLGTVICCHPKHKPSIAAPLDTSFTVLNLSELDNNKHEKQAIENTYSTNSGYNITLTACNKPVLVRYTKNDSEMHSQIRCRAICYDLT